MPRKKPCCNFVLLAPFRYASIHPIFIIPRDFTSPVDCCDLLALGVTSYLQSKTHVCVAIWITLAPTNQSDSCVDHLHQSFAQNASSETFRRFFPRFCMPNMSKNGTDFFLSSAQNHAFCAIHLCLFVQYLQQRQSLPFGFIETLIASFLELLWDHF